MRTPVPVLATPNVPGVPELPIDAGAPGAYRTPSSETCTSPTRSPGRSGISRNPPVNDPENEYVMCSVTRIEPSARTRAWTSASGRVNSFASAIPAPIDKTTPATRETTQARRIRLLTSQT